MHRHYTTHLSLFRLTIPSLHFLSTTHAFLVFRQYIVLLIWIFRSSWERLSNGRWKACIVEQASFSWTRFLISSCSSSYSLALSYRSYRSFRYSLCQQWVYRLSWTVWRWFGRLSSLWNRPLALWPLTYDSSRYSWVLLITHITRLLRALLRWFIRCALQPV